MGPPMFISIVSSNQQGFSRCVFRNVKMGGACIGVGAQSTLGGTTFLPEKYV